MLLFAVLEVPTEAFIMWDFVVYEHIVDLHSFAMYVVHMLTEHIHMIMRK